jgi:PAS domain S-box-containing protein
MRAASDRPMQNPAEVDSGEALRESERRLRLAVEAARLGIWDWNVITNEMVWSDEAKKIAGLPPDQPVTFEQVRRTTHPEDLPRTSAMARRALDPSRRLSEPYEYRIVRPDGEVRWVIANGEAVFAPDEDGMRAVRYIGTIRDVTDRKQAEQVLQASEARLHIAMDAARLGVWDYDVKTDAVVSSPELARVLGLPADAPLDRGLLASRYYPGDEAKVREAAAAAIKSGERYFQCEFRLRWPNGELRWLLLRAEIRFGQNGAPSGALGVVMDITDRKVAEERQVFLMRELIHRVRNTLASVRAIAGSTLRNARNLKEAETALSARIAALADVHMLLSNSISQRADLREIVTAIIAPHRSADDRISVDGPSLVLDERDSLALAMALHELATNATKYGALSRPEGRVELAWTLDSLDSSGSRLRMTWREAGGPAVAPPTHRGFGMRLIEQALPGGRNTKVELDFAPAGLVCVVEADLVPSTATDSETPR